MKKPFLTVAVAALALAGCSKSETVEVANSRAIEFNSFVNKNTRAVTEVTQLNEFYVFGNYSATDIVFNNESSTKTAYWVANQTYEFGAYYDGGKNTNASFDYTTKTLKFTDYTPDNGKDLVVATASHETDADVTNEPKVQLNFKHMLSQVKFTFNTTAADAYTIKISDLKFSAKQTETGTYNSTDDIIWTGNGNNAEYTYAEIADIAVEANGYTGSDVKFVIPQTKTNTIEVSFNATLNGPGLVEKTSTFTANLGYTASGNGSDNTWTPGFRYNYITTINPEDINGDLKKIEFEVKEIEGWKDATDTTVEL